MFSKKLLWAFLFIFIFLSLSALITNMPAKKNKRVFKEISKYFPYEITKEFGGLDIVDKRSGEDLDIANEKVFIAYDSMLREWGKKHLRLEGNRLYIYNDKNETAGVIDLKNEEEVKWVKEFFFQQR